MARRGILTAEISHRFTQTDHRNDTTLTGSARKLDSNISPSAGRDRKGNKLLRPRI
jgi:hypothetical protein